MGSALLRKGLWVLISCILNAELNTSRDLEGIFQYYGSKKTQRLPVYRTSRGFHIQLRFSTETCKGQLVEIMSEDTNCFLRIALPGIGPIRVSYSTPYGKNHSVSLKGEVCDGKRHSLWFSVDIFRVSYRVDKVPVRFYAASFRRLFLSPPNIVFGKGLKGCVSGSIFVFRFTETRGYRVGTSSGCSMNKSCSDELGMQNKRIANERITASSSKSTDNSPHFARLDGSKAWCSALYDKLPYIQIQLEEPKIITEIITQGSSYHRAWATKYEARFLENGK